MAILLFLAKPDRVELKFLDMKLITDVTHLSFPPPVTRGASLSGNPEYTNIVIDSRLRGNDKRKDNTCPCVTSVINKMIAK